MTIWFTADTHFGHANILKHEPQTRPFSSIEEHDAVVIERWNALVKPRDTVWHLGDVSFSKQGLASVAKLNGIKKLVLGNHDHLATASYLQFFNKVYGIVGFKEDTVLSHAPLHLSQLEFRWQVNLHGHTHSIELEDPRYINVGIDKWNLAPVSWEEVRQQVASL